MNKEKKEIADSIVEVMREHLDNEEIMKTVHPLIRDRMIKAVADYDNIPGLDLDKLEKQLDVALSKETDETMRKWLDKQRAKLKTSMEISDVVEVIRKEKIKHKDAYNKYSGAPDCEHVEKLITDRIIEALDELIDVIIKG